MATVGQPFGSDPPGGGLDAGNFGTVGDGIADDTLPLRAAVAAATARSERLFIPEGRFLVTGPITSTNFVSDPVRIRGAGQGRTVILQGMNDQVIDVRGSDVGSAIALTVDAATSATTLTVSSTAGWAAGDYLYVKSTVTWPGSVDLAVFGEIVRIKSVDSGTQVTLYGPIDESYAVASTSTATKLSLVNGPSVEDITFQNTAPGTRTAGPVQFEKTINARLSFETINADGPGAQLRFCVDFIASGCRFQDSSDDQANSRFGYGVSIGAYCRDGVVRDCFMRRGRHLVTTGANVGEGPPRHILIANCISTETTSAAFDTHEEGRFIVFSNCLAHTVPNRGFNIRSLDTSLSGCRAFGIFGTSALRVDPNAVRCKITDFWARDIKRDTSTQEAISIAADDCTLNDIRVEQCDGAGVVLSACNRGRVTDASFFRVGRFASTARYGIQLTGTGADHVLRQIYVENDQASSVGIKSAANVSNWVVDGLTTKFTGGGTPAQLQYDVSNIIFVPKVAPGSIKNTGTVSVDVASAAAVTLPDYTDFVNITGAVGITSIVASWIGRVITLKFASTPTITDGGNLLLASTLVATADDTLTLVCDGTNWYETGRSVN